MKVLTQLAPYRKALVALVGVLANVVSLNILPGHYQALAGTVLSLLTLLGVHQVPNAPLPGTVAAQPAPSVTPGA